MDVLDQDFFHQGAFITDSQTGAVFLGQGGVVTECTSFDHRTPSFYLKDFFQDKYLKYTPERWFEISRQKLMASLDDDHFEIIESKNYDSLYSNDFKQLKNDFRPGLQKVVLISREEFKVSDPEAARRSFIKKALTFGTGMPYGFWFKDYGVVGSTPELLYRISEKNLYTIALAGTARQGQENELLNSSKDRLEHELVVEDIREKLAPFCHSMETLPRDLISYKDIIHLKTEMKGMLKPTVDLKELTSALSPTAALGGYPMTESLEFLKSTSYQDQHPHRFFGSAFGLIAPDFSQFVVSIRNIQWRGELFFVESGGGVLPESVLEKELEEIALKRNTIKKHYL